MSMHINVLIDLIIIYTHQWLYYAEYIIIGILVAIRKYQYYNIMLISCHYIFHKVI